MTEIASDEKKLNSMYERVIKGPNKTFVRKGFIRCPDCGKEILLIPTLRVMNEAIENHVNFHKEQLENVPIARQRIAISVRFALMTQVLKQVRRFQKP